MADRQLDPLERCLKDAIAAETSLEGRFRDFAADCDDDDVRAAFLAYVDQAREHHEKLAQRFNAGSTPPTGKSLLARFFGGVPASTRMGQIQEERTVQYLILAYTIAAAAAAMYEGLGAAAIGAGDPETSALAREFQARHAQIAEKLFHFIHTRSIIAYNMLTITEIDPSVETKVGEASWIS